MKRLLTVLIVLAVCVVGFGFYRGWFALSSPSSPSGSNEVNVNLATDTDKMKADAETMKDKAAELTGNVTEGAAEPDDQPTDEAPADRTSTNGEQPPAVSPNAAQPEGN
jgi:hypothetical protein